MQIYEIFRRRQAVAEQFPVLPAPAAVARVPAAAVGGVPNVAGQQMPGGMATSMRQTGTMAAPNQAPNAAYGRITSNVPQMQRPAPGQPAAAQQARLPAPQTGRAVVSATQPASQSTNVPAVVQQPKPRGYPPPPKPGPRNKRTYGPDDVIDVDAREVGGQQARPAGPQVSQPNVSAPRVGSLSPEEVKAAMDALGQRNIPVGPGPGAQQPVAQAQPAAQAAATQTQPAAQAAATQTTTTPPTIQKRVGAWDMLQNMAGDYVSRQSGIPRSWIPSSYTATVKPGTAQTTTTTASATPSAGQNAAASPTAQTQPVGTLPDDFETPKEPPQQPSPEEVRKQKQAAAGQAAQAQMAPAGQQQLPTAAPPAQLPTQPAQARLPGSPTQPRLPGPTAPVGTAQAKPPALPPAAPTPPARRTGGKVPGQVSQSPNAVRKREARARARAAAARQPGAAAFGSMAQQLQQPRTAAKPPATRAPAAKPPATSAVRGAQPGAPTAAEYANLERRLQQALAQQQQKPQQ